jgi:hypothetical protein
MGLLDNSTLRLFLHTTGRTLIFHEFRRISIAEPVDFTFVSSMLRGRCPSTMKHPCCLHTILSFRLISGPHPCR